MKLSIQVKRNCLPEIAARTYPAARRGQGEILGRMRDRARANARVDTGRMRATTAVQGGTTLVAPMPYSGFQNYGTRRGIVADYWFSGAVETELSQVGTQLRESLDGVLKCA